MGAASGSLSLGTAGNGHVCSRGSGSSEDVQAVRAGRCP